MIVNNANLITFWPSQPFVEGGLLAAEGKTIVDFGKMGKLIDRYEDPVTIDAGGRFVLPGLVDAHAQLFRRFALSAPGACPPWREIEGVLDGEAVYWSALVSLLDAVRAGVTTTFAIGSGPNVSGSLEALAKAFSQVGVRGALACALSAEADVAEVLRENERFVTPNEMLRRLHGIHLTPELEEPALRRGVEAAEAAGARVLVSCAPNRDDVDRSLLRWGTTPIGRLERFGLWRRAGVSVHAPQRLPADEAVLRDAGAWLVSCPRSEMLMPAPVPKLGELPRAGGKLALGTDGVGYGGLGGVDLLVNRLAGESIPFAESVRLALSAARGSAELATEVFGPPLGCIKPGARADLVIYDAVPSTPVTEGNLSETLVGLATTAPVRTVIVNGRVLYHNSEFVGLDEARLRAQAREAAARLWERV